MKVMVEVDVEEIAKQIAKQIMKQLAESADFIQVVRCKDCKFYNTENCLCWDDNLQMSLTDEEWFCADADRR